MQVPRFCPLTEDLKVWTCPFVMWQIFQVIQIHGKVWKPPTQMLWARVECRCWRGQMLSCKQTVSDATFSWSKIMIFHHVGWRDFFIDQVIIFHHGGQSWFCYVRSFRRLLVQYLMWTHLVILSLDFRRNPFPTRITTLAEGISNFTHSALSAVTFTTWPIAWLMLVVCLLAVEDEEVFKHGGIMDQWHWDLSW